jgi:hypothetical protein
MRIINHVKVVPALTFRARRSRGHRVGWRSPLRPSPPDRRTVESPSRTFHLSNNLANIVEHPRRGLSSRSLSSLSCRCTRRPRRTRGRSRSGRNSRLKIKSPSCYVIRISLIAFRLLLPRTFSTCCFVFKVITLDCHQLYYFE